MFKLIGQFNKAWVAGIVAFLCNQVEYWFGFAVTPEIQALILAGVVYLVPNLKTT